MTKIILHTQEAPIAPYLDSAIFERIKARQVERFESLESASIISFDWYDVLDKNAVHAQLIVYFSAEHLFFICEDERLFNKVNMLFKPFSDNEKSLHSFFAELMKPDMDYLERLEDEIAELEDNLLTSSNVSCANEIVLFRKELIRLKKYYEQLNSIFEDILENENELVSRQSLRRFAALDNRVDRLFNAVLHLREFVSQVREAYQAQIDIEQNAIMKVFTVITSIFLPLTLIVGWYGMNLQMPEFSWIYGYPAVIALSVAVCIGSIAFFKRNKWF